MLFSKGSFKKKNPLYWSIIEKPNWGIYYHTIFIPTSFTSSGQG
jgi:hypothetical protein